MKQSKRKKEFKSGSGFVKPLIAISKTLWSEFPSNRIKRRMHKRRGFLLWKN